MTTMKILHAADIHLGDLSGPVRDGVNLRRLDTRRCMEHIVNIAREAKPHVAVVAGDLFNRSRVWADAALEDVNDAIAFLRGLAEHSEQVALLFGTDNHDNPRAFDVIARTTAHIGNIRVYAAPGVDTVPTSGGDVQILALPGFDRGRLRAFMPNADKETENRNATALINDVAIGLAAQLDKNVPSVLVAHYTVAGAATENGQTFLAGQDVVLLPQTIDATGVSVACLGHIHKIQKLAVCETAAFYSGSPNQLTFGDEGGANGVFVHRLAEVGGEWKYHGTEEHRTPCRPHHTLRLSEEDVRQFVAFGTLPEERKTDVSGAIVRVRYKASAEDGKALNKAELQKLLLSPEWAAFHVAEITDDAADYGVVVGAGEEAAAVAAPIDALKKYLTESGDAEADIERLAELAAPIMREADDGRGANRHAGAFTPISVEVENYRSYAAAKFDFAEIRMAMVNGPNGVGKSSLFMDAIADCLFEESRDGQLGGWLREGEKRGAVTLDFAIGEARYRVCRTRNASGKGTLAFSRFDADKWVDAGDTTMKLTQAKIEETLGMDAQTFCSVALIRQDAYGTFLDAHSDRRMETLSSLLDLGAYSRMEERAKAEASKSRAEVAALQDKIAALDETIKARAQLEESDAAQLGIIAKIDAEAAELETRLAEKQRAITLREEAARLADAKDREARDIKETVTRKHRELAVLTDELCEARRLSAALPQAEKAAANIEAARVLLDEIARDESDYHNMGANRDKLAATLKKTKELAEALEFSRGAHLKTIERGGEILNAVNALEKSDAALAELEASLVMFNDANAAAQSAREARERFLVESRARIGGIDAELNDAKKRADIMDNSECPVIDTATCAFLKDAKGAKDAMPELEKRLSDTKDADRETYIRMTDTIKEAEARSAEFGDPLKKRAALLCERDELKAVAALLPKLKAAQASIDGIDAQIITHRETIADTEKEIAAIDAKIPALEKSVQKARELRCEIEKNEHYAAMLPKCISAKATADAVNARIDALKNDIDGLTGTAAALTAEADKIRADAPGADTDADELNAQRRSLAAAREEAVSERGGIKARLERISEAEAERSANNNQLNAAARRLDDYTRLARAFGLDGVQHMIIGAVVPEIMRSANAILAAMTGGRMAVDFRTEKTQKSNSKTVATLDVWITSISGGCRPYASHSGGEKVKVALAVALGLADVKARHAGIQLGMLFIDEPPFLDADGTEAYADALASMAARNPAMRIIAISHDPAMKARFAQNIVVSEGERGSVVNQKEIVL